MNKAMRERAVALAAKCENAYSFDRYGSWPAVAAGLLELGFSDDEAEEIMRSKYTRWAADASNARYGKVPARAVTEFVIKHADHLRPDLGVRTMPKREQDSANHPAP